MSLGADHAFDYKSPTCGADIRKTSDDKLFYAWDAIAEGSAHEICAEALSSDPSQGPNGKAIYVNILFGPSPRKDVESKTTVMYTTFGESFAKWGRTFDAKPRDREFMKGFVAAAEILIGQGKIKPHNVQVRPYGLDGILSGLKAMSEGKISAKKLVYQIGSE
jgi:hypothetical protein